MFESGGRYAAPHRAPLALYRYGTAARVLLPFPWVGFEQDDCVFRSDGLNRTRKNEIPRQRASRWQAAIDKADQFQRDVEDAVVLLEFAADEPASLKELETVIERLEREVEEAETEMLLSGPNDTRDAIVTINAGAGGTDAQDWA